MNIEMVYNVPHEAPLTILLAIYFYLTGMSAGSFIMSTMAYGFGIKRFKPLGKVGVVMATLLLMIAPMNLLADMSQPLRFWHLFLYLNPTSPITWGSFLLTIYPLNCLIYAWFMFHGNQKLTKVFGLIGLPLAISVHGYTGFILAMGKGRILWNTALMPFLFLISAMVSGIALMILVVIVKDRFLSEHKQVDLGLVKTMASMLAGMIVLDLILVGSDVLVLMTSDSEARAAADMITRGAFSPFFLGVEIFLGSLIPLFLIVFPKTSRKVPALAVASFLVMVGIFAMRYVMVIGGQALPLS